MKKRLIFTLLYEKGSFVLSRNFRTQRIGDIHWLKKNYNFSKVSNYIDELVLINVSGDSGFDEAFRKTLSELIVGVFVPVTAGGGIRSMSAAESLFQSGADKILLNQSLFLDYDFVVRLSQKYGQQAVVGSLDLRRTESEIHAYSHKGSRPQNLQSPLALAKGGHIGEFYLNSIDQDGTGNGLDFEIVEFLAPEISVPLVLAGGAGKPSHLVEGLSIPQLSGVATANLLNFVGDGLKNTRDAAYDAGINLARWRATAF